MKKSVIIITIGIILLFISIFAGVYAYTHKKSETKDSNIIWNRELAQNDTYIQNVTKQNAISTIANQEKVSPNCVIIKKQYFKGCDHILRENEEIEEKYINVTKEEFEKLNKEWKIEEFASSQITMYKEKEGFCGKHYIIRENNGTICVYNIDENGKETLKQNTEIQTMYLPEEDMQKIRNEIQVIGDDELHSVLEDFE